MRKSFLFCLLSLCLILPIEAQSQIPLRRGLLVTVLQDPQVFSSREEIAKLIDFAKQVRIGTLFVQVYRANRAWFPSKVADSTPYDTAFQHLSEDPFQLLIKQAHESGIEVHAWLNLLSLSNNKNAGLLKKYGVEILTRNRDKKKKIEDYKIDNQYFLEPGDLRVREELAKLVEELLRTHSDLDGVLFDYIRYPDTRPHYGYTKMNMERFQKETGLQDIEEESQIWKDWKRKQVTAMLERLVEQTRAIRPGIQIGVTGCMSYSRAYHEAFQDWISWLERGLVDSVTMMSYAKETPTFERYLRDIKNKTREFSKINIGVGAYKMANLPQTFDEQFELCEQAGGRSCVVFHYGSLLENARLKEKLISQA